MIEQGKTYAVSIQRLVGWLVLVTVVVVSLGVVANVLIYHWSSDDRITAALQRLDLGHEPSIPAWFASQLLFLCSVSLASIGFMSRTEPRWKRNYWFFLAILFAGLSIDESVMIHEMADATLHNLWNTRGILFFAWVIPGLVFTAAIGLASIPFLRSLTKRTRTIFLVAGAVFVGGAIGMEMIAGLIFSSAGSHDAGVRSLSHTASQTVEESMELTGTILFLYGLLDHIRSELSPIRLAME